MRNFCEKYSNLIGNYKTNMENNSSAEKIIDEFIAVANNKEIYIYGAGTIGRNFVRLFDNIGVNIAKIFDRNYESIVNIGDYRIHSREELKYVKARNSVLIIAANRDLWGEICEDIRPYMLEELELINGHDLHMLLQSAYCMNETRRGKNLHLKDCYECTNLDNVCSSLNCYMKRINNFDEASSSGTKNVQMIGVILGNICTLKCKNCCESVPYVHSSNRAFVDKEQVLRDVYHLSDACQFLSLLEFIGGEPFLHPELGEIVQEVLTIDNIGMIHIFTNGTVIPSNELCKVLANERITIYISNYQVSVEGILKSNIEQTAKKFEKYGVQFFFGKKTSWMDFRAYDDRNKTEKELIDGFNNCFLHNCNRLYRGNLYVCPHQYAGINLGKLDKKNVIAIHDYDKEELITQLNFFKSYQYIDACKYCTMPYEAETVLSGEQL